MAFHAQRDDRAARAANASLDVVEREAGGGLVVDRDDRIAGAYAGADRGIAFDRVDENRARLRILADVHADAAEVAALEFFVERADRVGVEVRRIRIAETAEHAAQRDVGDLRFAAGLRITLVDRVDRAFDQREIVRRRAGRVARRERALPDHGGPFDAVDDQAVQRFGLAVDQPLRIDRLVVAVLDLLVGGLDHALVRIAVRSAKLRSRSATAPVGHGRRVGCGTPGIRGTTDGGQRHDGRGE